MKKVLVTRPIPQAALELLAQHCEVTAPTDDPVLSAADLAIQGELNTAAAGPTPDLEGLLSHRPALVAWKKRVEQRTGG